MFKLIVNGNVYGSYRFIEDAERIGKNLISSHRDWTIDIVDRNDYLVKYIVY